LRAAASTGPTLCSYSALSRSAADSKEPASALHRASATRARDRSQGT
jgi:hypothetical protein